MDNPRNTLPAVTLVNVLPKTVYKDAEDKKPMSGAYIAAQLAVLRYLNKNAADTLTGEQASAFTKNIGPKGGNVPPQDAVRLCYYMRQVGYDVYCKIDPKSFVIRLYVANQNKNERSPKHDHLYWKQDLKTGTQHVVSHGPVEGARTGRRNAISVNPLPNVGGSVEALASYHRMVGDQLGEAMQGEMGYFFVAPLGETSASAGDNVTN